MSSNVEFIYDADVSALMESLQEVGDVGAKSMEAISANTAAASESLDAFKESTAGAGNAAEKANAKFEASVEGIKKMGQALHEALESLGVLAGLEALKMLGEELEKLGEQAIQLRTLSEVTGLTTDQVQALALAGDDAGVGLEQIARTGERLIGILEQARQGSGSAIEKLKELGATNAQIADPTFRLNDLFGVLHDRLTDTATAQQALSSLTAELGPRAAVVAEALKNYDGSAASVKEVLNELNGLTKEQNTELAETAAEWDKSKKAAGNYVSEGLLKVVEGYKWLADAIGSAKTIEETSADINKLAAQDRKDDAADAIETYKLEAAAKIDTTHLAVAAQMDASKSVTQTELLAVRASVNLYKEGTAERLEAAKAYADVAAKYYGDEIANVDKVVAAQQQLRQAQDAYTAHLAELEDKRTRLIEQAEAQEIRNVDRMIAESSRYLDEVKKDAEAELEARKNALLGQIALQKELFDSTYSTRSPTAQAQGDNAFAAQQLAVWNSYYSSLAKDAATSNAEITKIQGQAAAQSLKTAEQIEKNNAAAAKQTEQQWLTALKPIGGAFSSMLSGMIKGTETFHQAWTKMEGQLLDSAIKMGVQELEKWIAKEAAKTAATEAAAVAQTTTTTVAAEAGQKANTQAASQSILVSAKQAAAGVYASVSEIPYVGWILAPVAAAAAFAAVAAFGSGLAFEKGGIVPHDANAQVHAGEMVLPRKISEGIQSLFGDGGSGGAGGGVSLAVSTMDARSFAGFLSNSRNRREIVTALGKEFRGGNRSYTR